MRASSRRRRNRDQPRFFGSCSLLLVVCAAMAGGGTPALAEKPVAGDVEIIEPRGFGDTIERHWLRIAGQTLDASGRPVAGATVIVANANRSRPGGAEGVLGTTTSDDEGRFAFDPVGVYLDVGPGRSPLPQPRQAWFELFAASKVHGWTWHSPRAYRPSQRMERPEENESDPQQAAAAFHQGEPIDIKLVFQRPVLLRGRVVDDVGRPLEGATVQIGRCDTGASYAWQCTYLAEDEPQASGAIAFLPEEWRQTVTDADGQWELPPVRTDSRYLFRIDPGPLYEVFAPHVVTGDVPASGRTFRVGDDGRIDHTFLAPREFTVHVIRSDDETPVAGLTVRATGAESLRAGHVATTDELGRARLQLRPGGYRLTFEPDAIIDLLPRRESATVQDNAASSIRVALDTAAVVHFNVRDSQSGQPVPGARIAHCSAAGKVRIPVQSQSIYIDNPATDAQGRLAIALPPGRKQFCVLSAPPDYSTEIEPAESTELVPGPPVTIDFELPRVADDRPPSALSTLMSAATLQAARQRQRRVEMFTGIVRGRRIMQIRRPDADDVIDALNELPLDEVPDLSGVLKRIDLQDSTPVPYTLTLGHGQRRVERQHRDRSRPYVTVFNLDEAISFDPANLQVTLQRRGNYRVATMGRGDLFTSAPLVHLGKSPPRPAEDLFEHSSENGRLTVIPKPDAEHPWQIVIDEATGMLLMRNLLYSSGQSAAGQYVWQFAPREFADGLWLPQVRISLKSREDQIRTVEIWWLEGVDEVDHFAPQQFAVSVPTATTVVDYRNHDPTRPGRPRVHRARSDIPDVLAHSMRNPPTESSLQSGPKFGDPAPMLNVSTWVDATGEIAAPDLEGRIVLVDFWGIDCGFCIAQLPEMRATAKHFAGSDVVFVSIHDDNDTADEVVAFAAAKKLDFPIGIDSRATERGWWGATSETFGVRGIPNAAVIDREGKLVFVGDLNRALNRVLRMVEEDD